MKQFSFLLLILFLTMTSCREKQPNIILICADDLGWSDLGCYGSEICTPNIDKLANEGMRFTHFYNTSKCFPSRACLLSGLYAQQVGYGNTYVNPISNAVTLGEVLKSAGYRTMWSGKHHGLENPVNRGFDRYFGLKDGACNHFNPGKQRSGEGKPARKGKPGHKRIREWCIDTIKHEPYTPTEKDFYTTDYFTNYALDWLDEYKSEEQPFFLYLAYTAPHDPLMAWPEDIAKYNGKYDRGYKEIRNKRYQSQLASGLIDSTYVLSEPMYNAWDLLTDAEKIDEVKKMEVYAAMIDRMDQNVGRVLQKIKEIEKDENTLILFVSDNGASAELVSIDDDYGEIGTMTRWASLGKSWANVANTPFSYFKNYSFEGGINTPFIAHWPGVIKSNTISDYAGHFIDLMATFIDVSNADYPLENNGQQVLLYEGESLMPILKGQSFDRKKPLFWEWSGGQAALVDSWKIVRQGTSNAWELYNMKNDPSETLNLANDNPEIVNEMVDLFERWQTKCEYTN